MLALGPLGLAALALKTAFEELTKVVKFAEGVYGISSQRFKADADKLTATIHNQELMARAIKQQRDYETAARVADLVSTQTPPILKLLGFDPGAATAGVIRAKGQSELGEKLKFLQTDKDFRQRLTDIGKYDTRTAQVGAISEFKKIARDVSESHILGGRMAQLGTNQQALDLVQQQISIAKKHSELQEHNNTTQKKIQELQEQLKEELKDLPPEIAKKIKDIGKDMTTPLNELLRKAPQIPGAMPNERKPIDAEARNRIAVPILGGHK